MKNATWTCHTEGVYCYVQSTLSWDVAKDPVFN